MDDGRVGAAIRALRRRKRWRQVDLAEASSVPQSTISELERGHLDDVLLRTVRAVLLALDAGCVLDVLWRGGALDRLLDERHASVVEGIVRELVGAAWPTRPEVSFSRYGERGSIDVLGIRPDLRAALVTEAKSDITSVEATNRAFDAKIRLAPAIIHEEFGFEPAFLGAALVLPESSTARRRIAEHRATFDARYPDRTPELRQWLRNPNRPLRAIWFLPDIATGDPGRRIVSPTRVTRPRTSVPPSRSR